MGATGGVAADAHRLLTFAELDLGVAGLPEQQNHFFDLANIHH
jgi:hypothetical protein